MNKRLLALIAIIFAVLIGLFVLGSKKPSKPPTNDQAQQQSLGKVIDGIPCNSEMLQVHYHAHLAMLQDGQLVVLPANIGIDSSNNCLYWLHTHQTDGIIHIESPEQRDFTLGQFFDVWGQPLSDSQAGDLTAASGSKLRFYVDGQLFSGDPKTIVLKPHQLLTIESGQEVPPPSFTFPAGD